jgi:DNA-binding MltR family transcriptional regulator
MSYQMWMYQTQLGNALPAAIKEIEESSDRAAAIVASALVEDHLMTVLKDRFHHDERIMRELFQGSGPLAPFSTKIKLAFLTGLLSARACKDLQTIRKIRNEFAHKLSNLTFETQNVKALAMSLTIPDWYNVTFMINAGDPNQPVERSLIDEGIQLKLNEPRHRYIISCRCFLSALTLVVRITPPIPCV